MHFHPAVSTEPDVRRRGGPIAALLACALALSACSGPREVRARILDTAGRPVPGAVLYAEAWTSSGAFDFAVAEPGTDGAARLAVRWRLGANLALSAFAPGKKPVVLYEPGDRFPPDVAVFRLEDLPAAGSRWQPRVSKLGFPFEDNPELAARAAAPERAALRRAFRAAYAPLAAGEESATPAERAKLRALDRLGQ